MQLTTQIARVFRWLLRAYWSLFYRAARVIALLMMVAAAIGAILLAVDTESQMDAPLRLGLVILLSVLAIACFKALRAPMQGLR